MSPIVPNHRDGGLSGSRAGSLTELTWANPLVTVSVPFCHVISRPIRFIFQPVPAS